MGYTHYFGHETWTKEDEEGYAKALPLIQDVLKRHKDMLRFEYNVEDVALADENQIHFNGRDEDGHETFHFLNASGGFAFCKTARKPYDLAVCEVLLILAAHCPNFEPSSDGFYGHLGEDRVDGMWQDAMNNVKSKYGLAFNVAVTEKRDPYYDWRPVFDGFVSAVGAGMKG
jgi:hypothetical protein